MTQYMFTFKENFEYEKYLYLWLEKAHIGCCFIIHSFVLLFQLWNKHRIAYANDISIDMPRKTSSTNHWLCIFEVAEFQVSTDRYFLCAKLINICTNIWNKKNTNFSCAIAQTILLV